MSVPMWLLLQTGYADGPYLYDDDTVEGVLYKVIKDVSVAVLNCN